VRTFDRIIGIVVTTASAFAATGLLIFLIRTPVWPGDVIWPSLLIACLAAIAAWTGVWAWANERWLLAAPTIFVGSLGAVGFMSMLCLIPMGFAGLALRRSIRRRIGAA